MSKQRSGLRISALTRDEGKEVVAMGEINQKKS